MKKKQISEDKVDPNTGSNKVKWVKITFEGTADGDTVIDEVMIHINSAEKAKKLFKTWIATSIGIKGCHGFHPLGANETIKITKVEEYNE